MMKKTNCLMRLCVWFNHDVEGEQCSGGGRICCKIRKKKSTLKRDMIVFIFIFVFCFFFLNDEQLKNHRVAL